MKFKTATQESLLALLCFDDSPQGARVVRALVPFKNYDPYFREIAEAADQYLARYKKPPGEHTLDLIEQLKEQQPDNAEAFETVKRSLYQTWAGKINREYVLGEAKKFVRRQKYKAAAAKTLQLLQKGKDSKEQDAALDEVDGIWGSTLKASTDLAHPGLLLNDPLQALSFLDREEDEALPLDIPEIDQFALGPARKKYHLTMAGTNTGKSWLAVHQGKCGLKYGYQVCHITCEMPEEEVAQRYVQALAAIGKREAKNLITRFRKDDLGRFVAYERERLKRPTLKDPDIRERLLRKLSPLARRPRLYIKEFPSGTLTIRQLRGYLDHLEAVRNFIPDLLIVDYPDLMDHDPRNKRAELAKIAVDLRGIAGERNIMVAGFSQVNESKQGKVIKTGRASEGRAKEHTADIIFTLNQTEAEYEMGLLRLFVAKARSDVKHIEVLISQALGIGQFCVESARMIRDKYWSLIDKNGDDEE